MKARFFSPQTPIHAIEALCIGFGLTLPLLEAMSLAVSPPLCLSACVAVALLLAIGDCLSRLRALPYVLLLGALALAAMRWRDHLPAVSSAATLFISGQPLALAAYSRALTVLLSVLFTCIGASLARSEQAFFPLALLTVFELLIISFLGLSSGGAALLPLLCSLLLSSRAPGVSGLRLLVMALATLLLTCALMPLAGQTARPLREFAEKTRQRIDDYLFFTEARTAFSLSSAGWQPYGQERLGGSVSPTDEPVMQVKTTGRALLRATAKNEYTGLAWADTTSGRRYLYVSPRFSQMRSDLFDAQRPDKAVLARLPGSRTIEVQMLSDSASTLFLTQRFLAPRGKDIVSYFSPSSEVFGTRSLAPGDSYAFSGRLLSASSEGVRAAVLTALDESDPYYETVKARYLGLPAAVEDTVYEIAKEITAPYDNAFDRAAALCTYLQRGFPYTLNQSEPPLTRDFVSWFLLEEKRGYCTSFASAMTVLARCVGLPARYIEGYAANPDEDGVARVTQQDAHAWSEVYFPGFGWLSFDATPGSSGAPDYGGSDPESPPEPDESPAPGGGTDEETPTPSPTPTPTPVPTPTPSPTPEHDDPRVTPTPEITPVPTPRPTAVPTPTPAPDSRNDAPPLWPFALLLILLLIALISLRFALTAPARAAQRYRNPGDQLLIYYLATQQALICMGIAPQAGEAPATYLWRAHDALGGRVNLTGLGKALCMARYSGRRAKPQAAQKARKTYEAVLSLMKPAQRAQMHIMRFVHGLKTE